MFSPLMKTFGVGVIIIPTLQRRDWGLKRLSNLAKVTSLKVADLGSERSQPGSRTYTGAKCLAPTYLSLSISFDEFLLLHKLMRVRAYKSSLIKTLPFLETAAATV